MRTVVALLMIFITPSAMAHPGHPSFSATHVHGYHETDLLTGLVAVALIAFVIAGVRYRRHVAAKR